MNANSMIVRNDGAGDEHLVSEAQAGGRLIVPTLRQYWVVLRRQVWLILGIVALALILAVIATFLATPKYTAVARLEVSRQSENVTNVEGVEREETGPSLEFYATQYALLDTRSLAARVALRLRLPQSDAFFAAHGEALGGLFDSGSSALTAAELRERERETIDLLLDNLTVSPIRGSALIDVNYTSADPELSARIANAWVEEFAAQTQDRRYASTADARKFLESRLGELRQRLENSERELVNYAAQQDIVRLSESRTDDGRTQTTQTLASADLEALNGALADATSARVAAEAQLRAINRGGASQQSVENPALNQLRERRAQTEAEYANLLVQFEPEYPAAQALAEQIKALNASITREEARVRQASQTSFESARAREVTLQARVDSLLQRFNRENRASIQYNIYQREVDTNRELYDALLQRYKEIGVAGVGSSNISIVDRASAPDEPSSPNLLLNLILGLLVGLTVAAAVVIVVENLDEGIRDPEQLNLKLRQPLLGVVPYLDKEVDPLEQLEDPKSELSEAYMTVRTNLGFSTSHGVPKTIAVTSSEAAEGKSTTSFALANLLARSGRKVVLMDLDMRRPMMDRMIGGPREFGMSNYLAGDDDVSLLLQPTEKPNLTFISAGPIPPSAAELLNSDRLAALLDNLTTSFDHVIVDSSPVLGLSDAPLIARNVDGLIFVVQARRTPARMASHALQRLSVSGAHILGIVLTKFQAEQSSYGYGYSYRYGVSEEGASGA